MRYELTDQEWAGIKPMLPNKPRSVPRVNDRRVLNGIFWVLRSGAPWRDLPGCFGPYTTCGRIEGINLAESSVTFGSSGRLFPRGFSPGIYRDAQPQTFGPVFSLCGLAPVVR